MKYDILCIGEMVIDFTPGKEDRSFIANPGGAPANVAIAATRLGRKAAFCGKLSEDNFGTILADTLSENQVALACPMRTSINTTLAFVHLTGNGERSFTFLRNPGADSQLNKDELPYEDITGSSIIHAGSCSLASEPAASATIQAMQTACQAGRLVSFDINYRNMLWNNNSERASQKIAEALPFVDLLKVSSEEIYLLGGEENICNIMKKNNIRLCMITYSSDGAAAIYKDKRYYLSSLPVTVADTNGAGDAFWGAVLSCLLEDPNPDLSNISDVKICQMIICGNTAGRLAVQSYGAIPALPYKDALLSACECHSQEDVTCTTIQIG